jgi:hypothetical protein
MNDNVNYFSLILIYHIDVLHFLIFVYICFYILKCLFNHISVHFCKVLNSSVLHYYVSKKNCIKIWHFHNDIHQMLTLTISHSPPKLKAILWTKVKHVQLLIIKEKMKSMLLIRAYYPPKTFPHHATWNFSEFSQNWIMKTSRNLQLKNYWIATKSLVRVKDNGSK